MRRPYRRDDCPRVWRHRGTTPIQRPTSAGAGTPARRGDVFLPSGHPPLRNGQGSTKAPTVHRFLRRGLLGVCAVEDSSRHASGWTGRTRCEDGHEHRGTAVRNGARDTGRGSEKSDPMTDVGDSGHVSLASRRPHTARSGCRRLYVQCQTHQVPFPSRLVQTPHTEPPESKDFLDPAIGRFGQPLALCVPLPPRWCGQLLDHAMRRRVRVRVPVHRLLPLAPRRHVSVDTRASSSTSPAHCSIRRPQAPSPGLRVECVLDLIEQPHHRALVRLHLSSVPSRQSTDARHRLPPARCSIAGTPRRWSS